MTSGMRFLTFGILFGAGSVLAQSVLTCSSDDMKRHYCDTGGGRARLVKQRSDAQCREGYSWGQDSRGIWVDHGCRADFEVGGSRGGWRRDRDNDDDRDRDRDRDRYRNEQGYAAGGGSVITCSSDDMQRHYCDTGGGRATLMRQHSDAACREGYSWGQDNRGVWVDHGCRADFQVGGGEAYGGYGGQGGVVTCSSDDMRRHYCDTGGGRATLMRQRSDAACREGYSWGQDSRGVWVDHGCRADFQVGGAGYGYGSGSTSVVTCSSDDMRRHYCDTGGGRATMLRQRSDAQCREGYSWGQDSRGIWVDHGCRADFQVTPRGYGRYRRR